jgi:hypothetical protein
MNLYLNMKLQFSGHDSFICKHFWLKKGYDFIQDGDKTFNDELAVVELGVGKNMVNSINYWLKCFGIVETSNELTELGNFLFDDNDGVDPYLENLGSIWLLHYSLIKTNKSSIYNLFFNEFRKSKFEFTKEQLFNFIKRKLESQGQNNFTPNTINSDISVFIRNYLKPNYKGSKIDIEDDFSNLMIDLDLLETYQSENVTGKSVEWYKVENKQHIDLPYQVILFSMLDNNNYGNSISFKELLNGFNSPGNIFAITDEGLYQKIEQITEKYKNILYTESAGVREIQFKKKPNKWEVLNEYYQD